MKVVIFCGGMGMRLHPATETIPKPLVTIGEKPIIWHLMKYYSYFGHKDFILCLGYKGEKIKKYFLEYNEYLSSDFILSNCGRDKKLLTQEDDNWQITFAETGIHANIGQRLNTVKKYLDGESVFLANYSDGLTDLYLPNLINYFNKLNKIGVVLSVKPFHSYHALSFNNDGLVSGITPLAQSNLRINGGYFVFKNEIFDYIREGEDLVDEPFRRLIRKQELFTYKFDGFWANMDTYKDKQLLEELTSNGGARWQVWLKNERREDGSRGNVKI